MSAIQKYSDIAKNLEFCDDFGEGPLLLGHFTQDRSLIGVISLMGGFIAMAALGLPGALFVAFAALNDLSYTGKDVKQIETSNDARTESKTLTQTELQPTEIILDVESIEVQTIHIPKVESVDVVPVPIATIPEVVKPSMGVSKILSPLEILIRARFSHRAFFGGQRTGKSYLAAIASHQLSQTGIKVFHMNLYSHGVEDSKYWTHAHRSVQCDLSSLTPGEAVPFVRYAQSILSEFKVTPDSLLIIDEITSMGNLRSEHLDNLQPFINGLVSYINAIRDSSKKRRKAVWTIAPGIVAGGLDQGVKELIKGLAPVLVSIPKDVSVMWEDQTLTTDLNVYGQLKVNYQGISEPPSMDCDRMVLIDNIWMPMGTLPPLSQVAQPSVNPDDDWEGIPDVECDGPNSDQWDLIQRFAEETGQGYFNNPNFDLWLKKQAYFNGKAVKVSSDNAPGKTTLSGQTIEVETNEVDERPDGLDNFPLVLTIWQYLDGKDSRSFSQINDAMRAKGKIPKDILMAKVPNSESYRDALKSVVAFGVGRGFLNQVSEDNYEAVRKH